MFGGSQQAWVFQVGGFGEHAGCGSEVKDLECASLLKLMLDLCIVQIHRVCLGVNFGFS